MRRLLAVSLSWVDARTTAQHQDCVGSSRCQEGIYPFPVLVPDLLAVLWLVLPSSEASESCWAPLNQQGLFII